MNKKLLFLSLIIAGIFTISLVSAYSFRITNPDWKFKAGADYKASRDFYKIDTKTTEEKYYYSYPTNSPNNNPSLWRNKQVYNVPRHLYNESSYDPYYYSPRYDLINDHWQWQF